MIEATTLLALYNNTLLVMLYSYSILFTPTTVSSSLITTIYIILLVLVLLGNEYRTLIFNFQNPTSMSFCLSLFLSSSFHSSLSHIYFSLVMTDCSSSCV